MFHPQLGVLNYLLSLAGLPRLLGIPPGDGDPLAGVGSTWQWTPLVIMVLGGLAAIPTEPYESAEIDGANFWQMFRSWRLPLITPFLYITGMITVMNAVEARHRRDRARRGLASRRRPSTFISTASPSSRSRLGCGDRGRLLALIVALAAVLLYLRRRTMWTEIGGGAWFRQIIGRIGLWFAVFVIVSRRSCSSWNCFSLSLKFEVDNAAYPPVLFPGASPGRSRRCAGLDPLRRCFRRRPDRDRRRPAGDGGWRACRLRRRADGGTQSAIVRC